MRFVKGDPAALVPQAVLDAEVDKWFREHRSEMADQAAVADEMLARKMSPDHLAGVKAKADQEPRDVTKGAEWLFGYDHGIIFPGDGKTMGED